VADVVVLLAVGEVWGIRGVTGWIQRAIEKPRGAAVGEAFRRGSLASLPQRRFPMAQFPVCRGRLLPAHLCAKVPQLTDNKPT